MSNIVERPAEIAAQLRKLLAAYPLGTMDWPLDVMANAATALEKCAASDTWKPIKTAPKDGRHILVVAGDQPFAVYEAYYEADGDRGWFQANTHWTDAADGKLWNVSRWMPLPSPPKETA